MSTPYITPAMLTSAPTGVPWSMFPFPKASSAQQTAEQVNICWRASGEVDGKLNQTVRATLDTEQVHGPDYRLTVDSSGVGRAMLSRWPVTAVKAARVCPRAVIPRTWTVIPADAVVPETPPIGVYGSTGFGPAAAGGNAVLVAPGYVGWNAGRNGWTLEVTYLNGWPHGGLTATADSGATQVSVDDVTGFAGAQAMIFDGADTEQVQVTDVTADTSITVPGGALVPAGPGTLTLASATGNAHTAAAVISAIPQDIIWATMLYAAAEVIPSGASAVTIQSIPGSKTSTTNAATDLRAMADEILARVARVI